MALTEGEANFVAGVIGVGIAAFIGASFYNNTQTVVAAMDQIAPNITPGQIPTAAGGINNPLDLRSSAIPWQGKITPSGSAFEQFQNMWQGYRAGIDTLKSHYAKYGQNTLNLFFAGNSNGPGYAPASDGNNPVAYAQAVATAAGISPDDDFGPALGDPNVLQKIIAAMAIQEQGSSFTPNPADIQMAMANLGIVAPTA
jgi:hypothetical protein